MNYPEAGDRRVEAEVLNGLARAWRGLGEHDLADDTLAAAMTLLEQSGRRTPGRLPGRDRREPVQPTGLPSQVSVRFRPDSLALSLNL